MTQAAADSSTEFTELVYSIIETWRAENPGAQGLPGDVRRQINRAVREDNRRNALEYQRVRTDIEAAVHDHQHNMLVGYRPRVAETYESWFARQQQLAKQRLAIEQRINAEPRLTVEDRGQAVTALSVAHHAPSTPALPVFTPRPPTGLRALRARVQAKLAQFRAGMVSDRDRRKLEAWAQVHHERREQARLLVGPDAAGALDVSHALGLHDHGVWISRDLHEQQAARMTEFERASADRETRLAELETAVAELRADNKRLATHAADLAEQLAQGPVSAAGPSTQDTARKLQSELFRLYDVENRPDIEWTEDGPQWGDTYEAGGDPQLQAAIAAAENKLDTFLKQHRNELGTDPHWQNYYDPAPREGQAHASHQDPESTAAHSDSTSTESDSDTANLIGAAHPNIRTPQPKQPASATAGANDAYLAAARSATDGLDI
ncbi:MAG: hypothetical protein HOQ24_01405 [Mycobacteriaceae bacterium]|nr:hypothetical protein [Mycobacteriaceae bacterium]